MSTSILLLGQIIRSTTFFFSFWVSLSLMTLSCRTLSFQLKESEICNVGMAADGKEIWWQGLHMRKSKNC